jgi:hypothetical protein
VSPARATLVIAGVLFGTVSRAWAVDGPGDTHGLPCRPTIACTAEIVVPGAVEIEAGLLTRSLAAERQVSFPFLLKLSLTRWVQLQVGSNGYTAEQGPTASSYFDNMTLGAKVHFLDQGDYRPALAVSAAAGFPVASQEGQMPTEDVYFTGFITKDIGPLHADLNVGANLWRLDGGALPQEWVALALSTSLPPPFGLMVESYYFTDASPSASRDGGTLFAVSHSPKPWLTFDAGGDIGYLRNVPGARSFSAFIGMTIIPFVLWRG